MTIVLAFDLGGTRLKAGVVDATAMQVLASDTADVAGMDADTALDVVAGVGRRLLDAVGAAGKARPLVASGMALPGIVDAGRVQVLPGKLAGIEGRDLRAWLRDRFGASVAVVDNDAVAHAMGEVTAWSAEGLLDARICVLTVGTGIGCTVLEGGQPALPGPWGRGMLGGHLPIADPVGPLDTAGRSGTFEARCRADRIVGEAREAGCSLDDVPGVYAAARAGEPAALAGLAAYRRWLVRGLVAITNAYAPSHVLLGGGPITPDGLLLDGVQQALEAQVWAGTCPSVRATRLDTDAALLGVAVMVRRAQ